MSLAVPPLKNDDAGANEAGFQDFWGFSLAFYEWPKVKDLLLGLQDGQGAAIDLMLLGCWRAVQGHALTAMDGQGIIVATQTWRDIVARFRQARRQAQGRIKNRQDNGLYQKIMATERQAEEILYGLLAEASLVLLSPGLPSSVPPSTVPPSTESIGILALRNLDALGTMTQDTAGAQALAALLVDFSTAPRAATDAQT